MLWSAVIAQHLLPFFRFRVQLVMPIWSSTATPEAVGLLLSALMTASVRGSCEGWDFFFFRLPLPLLLLSPMLGVSLFSLVLGPDSLFPALVALFPVVLELDSPFFSLVALLFPMVLALDLPLAVLVSCTGFGPPYWPSQPPLSGWFP